MEEFQNKNVPNAELTQEPEDTSIGGLLEKVAQKEQAITELMDLQQASRDRLNQKMLEGPVSREELDAQKIEEDLLDVRIQELSGEIDELNSALDGETLDDAGSETKPLGKRALNFFLGKR